MNNTRIKIIATLLLLITSMMQVKAEEAMLPECSLSPTSKSSILHFSISNRGNDTWHLLKWHSPFDAWFSEFIQLTLSGEPVLYEGALAKRGQPDEEDYLIIEAGEEVGVELDLSEAFQLESGHYRVELKPLRLYSEPELLIKTQKNPSPSGKTEQDKMIFIHCEVIFIDI